MKVKTNKEPNSPLPPFFVLDRAKRDGKRGDLWIRVMEIGNNERIISCTNISIKICDIKLDKMAETQVTIYKNLLSELDSNTYITQNLHFPKHISSNI